MSQPFRFEPKIIMDERKHLQEHYTPVLRGYKNISYQQITGSGDSNSLNFSCQSKTPNSEIDRNIQLLVPIRFTITIGGGIVPSGLRILEPEYCNMRSFPLHKAIQSMNVQLNNETFTTNIGSMMAALEHYNTNRKLKLLNYSKTPTYGTCQVQDFVDLEAGTRSELTTFASSIAGIAPQAFPFTVVSQTNDGTTATAVIDALFIESLQVPPLHWGEWQDNDQALRGIKNMNFNFKWMPNAPYRMIAIENSQWNALTELPTVTMQINFNASDNFSYSDLSPKLLINFLEPQCPVAPDIQFLDQFEFKEYTSVHASLAASASRTLSSQVINTPNLPRKLLIFVQRPITDFTDTPFNSDTMFAIENLEIIINGVSFLSTAHMGQVYDMCLRNDLQLEYSTWRGIKYNKNLPGNMDFGYAANQFASTGTPIFLDILDLGLDDDIIANFAKQTSIQVNVLAKNVSNSSLTPVLTIAPLTNYMTKIDVKQNSIESRMANPIVIFDEKKECNVPLNKAPLELKFAKRSGNWAELQHNIRKGDVYPF